MKKANSPAAFNASIMRGPTSWMAHWPTRRTWRKSRASVKKIIRSTQLTLLCKDEEGKFAGRIQCQYHAWTYKLDGTLANAPHMEKVQGFCEKDYPLNSVAAALWDGHIFI